MVCDLAVDVVTKERLPFSFRTCFTGVSVSRMPKEKILENNESEYATVLPTTKQELND